MAAWCFPDDPRTVREILDSIHSIECRTLQETEDSAWVSMGEWSEDTHDVNSIVEVFYDRRKHYQIVCYLTARLPWVVRSTFHDYDCTDHDRSKLFFKPIIESLQFHDADA